MERTLFSDLVVSRGGAGRVRAGGMPLSMVMHAVAFTAVIALFAVAPEPLPVPPPPRIDEVVLPTLPRPPAATTAAVAPRRDRSARPRTAVAVVDIDTPPAAVPDPDPLPFDARAGFCIGCAPSVGPTDGTGDAPATVGGGDGPPAPTGPVRPGGLIQAPRKIRHVDPEYPELARRAGVAGVVVLDCVIDREGAIRSVQLVSGHPLLNEAAISAVRRWAYRPTLLNGVPIEVVMTVTVRFTARPR